MDNNYKVYMHTFPDNKVYIGITRQSLSQRWGKDGYGYQKQPVYNAIKKYGWDNIKHELVEDGLT
jgi:predicted GIY-YIG superfamily endonuclease